MLLDKGGDYLLASSPPASARPTTGCSPRPRSGTTDGHGITYAAFQFPTTGNPHLDLAYLHSQREEMGEAMFAQEYEAQFLDTGGAVFRDDDIDAAIQADSAGALSPSGELLSEPEAGRALRGRHGLGPETGLYGGGRAGCDGAGRRGWWGCGAGRGRAGKRRSRRSPASWPGSALGGAGRRQRHRGPAGRAAAGGHPRRRAEARPRRAGAAVGAFLFTGDSKQQLVDRLNLRLSARRLAYPAHRVLLSELRGFEYLGNAGSSGRTRTGASGRGHDDVVMSLALAVYCAPESAPTPLASRILLGSQSGGVKRTA